MRHSQSRSDSKTNPSPRKLFARNALAAISLFALTCANAAPFALADGPQNGNAIANSGGQAADESGMGIYANDHIRFIIEGHDGTHYRGTIYNGKDKYPFMADRDGDTLRGTFLTPQDSYAFTLTIGNGPAVFKTGTATYQLTLQAAPTAAAQAGAPQAGFQVAAGSPADGSAALYVQTDNATAATTLAAQCLRDLTPYFDAAPTYRSGAVNQTNDIFEGMFSANVKGQPVIGMMLVILAPPAAAAQPQAGAAPRRGWVGVIFDRPTTLQTSAGGLLKALSDKSPDFVKAAGGQGANAVSLDNVQPTVLADGSEIRVPDGWQITAQAPAAIALTGPQGAGIILGQIQAVTSPRAVAMYEHTLHAPFNPNLPVGDYGDVRAAIRVMSNFYAKRDAAQGKVYRLVDIPDVVMTSSDPNKQQAHVRTIYEEGTPDHMVRYECIADLIVQRQDQDHWLFFCNAIASPQPEFDKDLPLMMQIVKSYRCNPQLLVAAQIQLAQVRQAAVAGLVESAMNKMRTMTQNFQVVDQIINDQECVTDGHGHKFIVPLSQDRKYIDALNQKFHCDFKPVEQLQ